MVLIIDDDPQFAHILQRSLHRRQIPALCAHSVQEALTHASTHRPDQVILDLNLCGESGLSLIQPLLLLNPGMKILVLTGYASIATAVEAIKLGAWQYLSKPVDLGSILSSLCLDSATGTPLARSEDHPETLDGPLSVNRLTWEHIQRVLHEHDGNISATARALNMHRRTLQRKLAKRPVQQ